jgi:hypothetical protein
MHQRSCRRRYLKKMRGKRPKSLSLPVAGWSWEPFRGTRRQTSVRIPSRPHAAKRLIAVHAVLAAAVLAGCGSQGAATGSHSTTGGDHTPGGPPPAITLTTADNGKTVSLSSGQSLAVRLDPAGGMSWHLPAPDNTALRLTTASGGYPNRGPALATFAATAPGRVRLHSITDAACLHAQPSCALPQRTWQVTVVVAHS